MTVRARICWLKPEEGGRMSPPLGPSYSTVARFRDAKIDWPAEAWSLVLDLPDPVDASLCTIANVRFLSPEGPVALLRPGGVFELFEGRQRVAIGTIL